MNSGGQSIFTDAPLNSGLTGTGERRAAAFLMHCEDKNDER
jgi:hypothetical protein